MNMDDLIPEPEAPLPPHILQPLVPEARWTSTRLAGQLLADSQAFYLDWATLQGQPQAIASMACGCTMPRDGSPATIHRPALSRGIA